MSQTTQIQKAFYLDFIVLFLAFAVIVGVSWGFQKVFLDVASADEVINHCAVQDGASKQEANALATETLIWLQADPSLNAYTWKLKDRCHAYIEQLRQS